MGIVNKKSEAAFPFGFTIKSVLGNKKRKESLSTSINLILTTPIGTVVYNPNLGSHVPSLVFDIISEATINLIYFYVENDLRQDPRIRVTGIIIDKSLQHTLKIFVNYEDVDDVSKTNQQTNVEFTRKV